MTRGALTTFSIANDVAKYFAIVPALFAGTLPWLKHMDVMQLHSPTSAILSAVIFNAIIIPLLIPIALRGVRYRPVGADALLRRNLLIWGLGGVIVRSWASSSSTSSWSPCIWQPDVVGVEIMVTHNPLHRSGQAALPHPALALGGDGESHEG